jgi:hypothetical protein
LASQESLWLLAGHHLIEQLPDQPKSINLIVVLT